jgi:hypothetical protein
MEEMPGAERHPGHRHEPKEAVMAEQQAKAPVRIQLTPEQQEQVRLSTGMTLSELEIKPESLEERIAPMYMMNKAS